MIFDLLTRVYPDTAITISVQQAIGHVPVVQANGSAAHPDVDYITSLVHDCWSAFDWIVKEGE